MRVHLVGTGSRLFPGISFTTTVRRSALYHILHLAVPMMVFSLLSILQGAVEAPANVAHRAQMALTLVLTTVAYKMVIANKLPPVSYLTLMDKYTLWNAFFVIVVAIQSRLLDTKIWPIDHSSETTGQADRIFYFCSAGAWALMQLCFIAVSVRRHFRPRTNDENLTHSECLVIDSDGRRNSSVSLTRESHRVNHDCGTLSDPLLAVNATGNVAK